MQSNKKVKAAKKNEKIQSGGFSVSTLTYGCGCPKKTTKLCPTHQRI